jgi:Negative regulator of sigma F
MTDEEIDKVLQRASRVTPQVEPALLKRIADSINASLQPVRPLPSPGLLAGGLALICAVLAVTAAAGMGFGGFRKLSLGECALIFSTLGILVWVTGKELVSQLIPGSRRRLNVVALLVIISAALLGVFALVFRDYRTDHFVSAGIACLLVGVLMAIPAALLSWLLLRRGFAVNPVAAGLAGGTLAGLCGVTMLELHCPNFLALHVLVWHTAVVPVSAVFGALIAWALRDVLSGEIGLFRRWRRDTRRARR